MAMSPLVSSFVAALALTFGSLGASPVVMDPAVTGLKASPSQAPLGSSGSSGPTYPAPPTTTYPTPPTTTTPVPGTEASAAERQIFEETNAIRARAGKPALIWDDTLADTSRAWSRELARIGKLQHDTGQTTGYFHGENCYWTSGNNPESAAEAWRNSPGHYSNMIGDYTRVGVGAAPDGKGGWYVTQRFLR